MDLPVPADLSVAAFFIALLGGVASFVSPCVLPLLPAYLSFVSGLSVEETKKGNRKVLWGTLGFVLGFSAVFVLLGAGFSFAGALVSNRQVLRYVGGGLLLLLGAVLVGLAVPRFMQRDVRPFLDKAPKGPAGAFLVGAGFALGWTPCVGPILGAILTMAAETGDPAAGALLLFAYSLGMGIPFMIAGLFVGWALRAFGRIRRHMRTIQIISGVVLIVYGALLLAGVPLSF